MTCLSGALGEARETKLGGRGLVGGWMGERREGEGSGGKGGLAYPSFITSAPARMA